MSAGGGREEGAAAAAMLQLLREQPEPQAEESGAQRFALCLPPGEEEVKEVEETIEEMLIRLDEFCGMTDVIRSDTSQILDETIPLIKAKVVEMNNIYAKVDKLEKHTPSAQHTYDLPKLYRTEDYFPTNYSTGMPIIKRSRKNIVMHIRRIAIKEVWFYKYQTSDPSNISILFPEVSNT
ncbi:breast carcinoma-amplified sequence 4 isoform X6 [Chelonia mydas]|uniref:breast carcinoma-amplified sequence 4 isoform X6 n=1 Tax=Chelonia mydas TaxID=8469 RepID=UPI001CA8CDA1|nr:breast carcinoma-amplified sequence 4 isoform X6 [Chelonia mydas]